MGLVIDGAIIIIYFVAITAIGLYMGRREKSLHDFALGGRRVPWWAVMASLIAAETSAATFLGAPGEGYDKKSLAYVQLVFGLIIGRYIVGYLFLKPYYRYRVYTVYDYLGVRFGPITKNYVSALFLIMRTLASGTRLFVPSLVMVLAWRMFTGGDVQFSQQAVNTVPPYVIAIVLLTIVTCAYTAIGGIKAVIWTDVIQATLMFTSALVAIATLLYHIGGLEALVRAVPAMAKPEGYFLTGFEATKVAAWKAAVGVSQMNGWEYVKLILASDYTVFSALIATVVANMAAFGTDQDMVQRLLTAETHQKARRSLITAAFMDLPIAAAFTFIGILLYVYYTKDPTWRPEANSDVFGAYILHVMPVGIRGLVLAGVFATAMGSLSAALNALATSATNDWWIPYFARRSDEAQHVRAARVFTVIFAILMIVIAGFFAYAKVTNPDVRIIPVVLGIAGFILGPMLGVFLIGMFTRGRGSDRGNILAVTCGLVATVVLGELHIAAANTIGPWFGVTTTFVRPDWLPRISFTWFAMAGASVVFAIGVLFRTPEAVLASAERKGQAADAGDDRPLTLREAG
ncbi:MAG: sodium/solute symporter [Chthonomonadales bacterium]|nr:sodium/solute symporter [Chthonomonadales bacterium]